MNILNLNRLIIALAVSALTAGCASSSTMSYAEKTDAYDQFIESEKLESLKRITAFRLDSWSSLADQHMIIRTNFNRPYLLTFYKNCYDLRFAQALIVNQTGSSLDAKFDSITIPDSMHQRCYIKSIYKLTKEQKKTLVQIGRKEDSTKEQTEEKDT